MGHRVDLDGLLAHLLNTRAEADTETRRYADRLLRVMGVGDDPA
jgi:hypothetical protein